MGVVAVKNLEGGVMGGKAIRGMWIFPTLIAEGIVSITDYFHVIFLQINRALDQSPQKYR